MSTPSSTTESTPASKPIFASYGSKSKPASEAASGPRPRLGLIFFVLLIAIGVALYAGFAPKWKQRIEVINQTRELSAVTVAVVTAAPGKADTPLSLPAELRALNEAAIYARANGYVKRWLVDIGAKVKEGDLLAEIDTPEVSQQHEQSRAELLRAEAALDLAKTTAERWKNLVKTKAVGEQEVAEKEADVKLQSANVTAQKANVRRLEEMLQFARVIAPFAGTITERHTDVGDLVSTDKNKVMFQLVQTGTLHAFVRVPQFMARSIKTGQSAILTVPELPGKTFDAKVLRTAGAMDSASRTLLVEMEADNKSGELIAGSYAQVGFPDARPDPLLTLPANTLLIRPEGPLAAIVGADNKVHLSPLNLGRDFGSTVEVISGVTATDRVILNPPDAITEGAVVRVAEQKAKQ